MTLEETLQPCLIHIAALKTFEPVSGLPVVGTRKLVSEKERLSIRKDIKSGLYSLTDIARRHERTQPTISHYLRPGEVLPKGYTRKVPPEKIPHILELRAAGMTFVDIGKMYDISPASVSTIIKNNKVET